MSNSANIPFSETDRAEFVPLSWTLGNELDTLDTYTREIIETEKVAPVEVTRDLALRAKILDACGLTCTFCHNEGTPVAIDNPSGTIQIRGTSGRSGRVSVFSATNNVDFIPGKMDPDDPAFQDTLQGLRTEMGLRELHLTGGEPTLHPQLPGIVRQARAAGYKVSMTSNGERGTAQIEDCAAEGLDKINFSIFGTTPEGLAEVQSQKYQDVGLAERKIEALHESIKIAADAGIRVAANLVMGSDEHSARVMRLIEEFDPRLELRILPDLSHTQESARAIYTLLGRLGAQPLLSLVEAGSSNARVKYGLPSGRTITFKQIRPTRLPECSDCQFNSPEACKEGFYGVRLYVDQDGQYKVGVCLQRMDLVQDVDAFLGSELAQQVADLRQREYEQMQELYSA